MYICYQYPSIDKISICGIRHILCGLHSWRGGLRLKLSSNVPQSPCKFMSWPFVGFGTQSFLGGQWIRTTLQTIWQSFKNIPNHILASPHVTSAQLLGFFLVIIQLPLLWLHVSKLRYLFMAKTIVMPLSALTLFVWALVEGKIITIVHSTRHLTLW
jgi:hypothetical protein